MIDLDFRRIQTTKQEIRRVYDAACESGQKIVEIKMDRFGRLGIRKQGECAFCISAESTEALRKFTNMHVWIECFVRRLRDVGVEVLE